MQVNTKFDAKFDKFFFGKLSTIQQKCTCGQRLSRKASMYSAYFAPKSMCFEKNMDMDSLNF